jgi:hypothetical protein
MKGKVHFKDRGIDRKIIFKLILNKLGVRLVEFIWFGIERMGPLVIEVMNIHSP